MRVTTSVERLLVSFRQSNTAFRIALCAMLILPAITFGVLRTASAQRNQKSTQPPAVSSRPAPAPPTRPAPPVKGNGTGSIYYPTAQPVKTFAPVDFEAAAMQEALEPSQELPTEIRAIHAPKGDRPEHKGTPIRGADTTEPTVEVPDSQAPPPSATGVSPGPIKSFKGEFLTSTSIPPDTMGAVGDTHIVNTTNDRMRIQTRDGVEISRVTLTSFWAGVTIKGQPVSAFDPKVMYDRFNDRFMLISTFNAQSVSSGAGFAVSQTSDPTGLWNRFTVEADPASTAAGGRWIDYPSMGFNKNWIIVNYNTFGFGSAGGGYLRSDVFVLDKQAAYANTLTTISAFQAETSTCVAPFEGQLGCGFTMAPTIVEDNTSDTAYLIEDWDSQFGQLRISKLTGTPSAPVLTVGTQFPQSPNSWRFNALRIGPASGGYMPQRQQAANLPSGTRIMANDSRMQNAVLRNGTLWCAHTVMLAATATPAGVSVGGAANPDIRSGIQWWEVDPTIEAQLDPVTGLGTPPIQRARIEDPTANNCHNGSGGLSTVPTCDTTLEQVGEFFAFPNISVNANKDVLIGFSKFSPLTYPSGGYVIRRNADAPNTTRDQVVFRPGQANYNLGAGTGATRQNRWGDYSASQTDPLDDTKFWTVQEYAGTVRDFGIGLAGNWETWWAQVDPAATQPSTSGNLLINEFRLRGPQGARDEYVELVNPGTTPVIVTTTDNSDGWSLVFSADGTAITNVFAVIPNGTVVPAKGRFLVANNPDGATAPTLVYSLNAYPAQPSVRGADSDVGYSVNLLDNGGLALFRTATQANYAAGTRIDSVGFSTIAAGLFKEGAGIPAMTVQPTTNFAFFRDLCGKGGSQTQLGGCPTLGLPKDSNDNAVDFVFVDVNGTSPSAGVQRLGAPGPENLSSPLERNSTIAAPLLDFTKGQSAPNRARDLTSDPANNSTFGTLAIRRRFVNNTGASVTRLRFRIVDITTFPPAAGFADLRARTSTSVVVSGINDAGTCQASNGVATTPCSVTVQGTTLETPPGQPEDGGFNSTLSAGTVTLAAPLANGASVNIQFLLGVEQTGTFKFVVNIEALP